MLFNYLYFQAKPKLDSMPPLIWLFQSSSCGWSQFNSTSTSWIQCRTLLKLQTCPLLSMAVLVRWQHGDLPAAATGGGATDHHTHVLWTSQSPVYQEVKTEHRVCSARCHAERMNGTAPGTPFPDYRLISGFDLTHSCGDNEPRSKQTAVYSQPAAAYTNCTWRTVETGNSNLWNRLSFYDVIEANICIYLSSEHGPGY